MSAIGKSTAALLAFVVLMLCSFAVQASIAQAEQRHVKETEQSAAERAASADRWQRAVAGARRSIEPVADAARAAIESAGDLADAEATAALDGAVTELDRAMEGRDLGAMGAARTAVRAAHAAFLEAVCVGAEARVAANGSADPAAKDEAASAITDVRAAVADGEDAAGSLERLRSASDRVVASHAANVAAAAAGAAAAAAAAGAPEEEGSGASSSTTPRPPSTPLVTGFPPQPPLRIEAAGDYRPGCETEYTWDWWYPDSATGYVLVAPAYSYDYEVMWFEGRWMGVKSLPCLL